MTTYLNAKFKGKPLSCIQVNTVFSERRKLVDIKEQSYLL